MDRGKPGSKMHILSDANGVPLVVGVSAANVHDSLAQPATATGVVIETRARFGFTAAPGSTDDGRMRRSTQHLPPVYAARLFDAQAAGATEQ